jgi:hypothetical protein
MYGWAAVYADDSIRSGPDVTGYRDIPRDGLRSFRVTWADETVFETTPPPFADARHLRYRITTDGAVGQGGMTDVVRLVRVGWFPAGPAYLIDPSGAVGVCDRWHVCDDACAHAYPGWFDPPPPVGTEA